MKTKLDFSQMNSNFGKKSWNRLKSDTQAAQEVEISGLKSSVYRIDGSNRLGTSLNQTDKLTTEINFCEKNLYVHLNFFVLEEGAGQAEAL